MGLPITAQAFQAALALLSGLLLAALYDFLKALRLRAARGWFTAAADALFCAALLPALFVYALGPGEGRLRLFALASAALGWALWRCTLSPYALRAFSRAFSALFRALSPLKKIQLRKKIEKNIFSKLKYGFTIWKNRRRRSTAGRDSGGRADEAKQVWDYSSPHSRSALAVRPGRDSGDGGRGRGVRVPARRAGRTRR